MKLVPIEPTPEMVKACYAWFDGFLSVGGPRSTVYRAMLAASPTLLTDLLAVVEQLREEIKTAREDERAKAKPERIMEEALDTWKKSSTVALRGDAVRIIARAIQAAEERGAARAIVVKPLEWNKNFESKTLSWSETIIGRYRVWSPYGSGGEWYWELAGKTYAYPAVNSEDEAKAAAQADYEACIRSTLTDQKSIGE